MIQLPIAQALLRCPPARRSDLSAVLSNGMELMTSDRRVNRSSKGRGPTDPFPYLAPLDGRPPVKKNAPPPAPSGTLLAPWAHSAPAEEAGHARGPSPALDNLT